jgi:hypothetical protein
MPKAPNNRAPRKNATEERLRATPFDGVDNLDAEENAIRLDVWRRLTEAKVVEELLTKPEFSHVVEELKAGLSCSLHGTGKDQMYKISSEGRGLKLEVNKKFADSLGDHQVRFFQGVVQAGIEGYGALYMQVKGLLKRPNVDAKDFESPRRAEKASR